MTKLTPCKSCHRHCRTNETSCPFCGVRRLAIGAGVIAIATLAIACDGPAAQTPSSGVVIPQPSTSVSSMPAVPADAGAVAPIPAPTSTPAPTTSAPPPDQHRMAPMYGMPPMDPTKTR